MVSKEKQVLFKAIKGKKTLASVGKRRAQWSNGLRIPRYPFGHCAHAFPAH
jgi:hypothetical protein